MKKIIVLLAIFVSFGAAAQNSNYDSTKTLQQVQAIGNDVKNFKVRGQFILAQDTFKMAVRDSGSLAMSKGKIYSWNGYKWNLSSGSSDFTDSIYVLSAFKNFSDPLNDFYKNRQELSILTSLDGKVFSNLNGGSVYGHDSTYTVRDPSIIINNDSFAVAHTSQHVDSGYFSNHFDILVSSGLEKWQLRKRVSTAAISGTQHSWAPEFFRDPETDSLHVFIALAGADYNFKEYCITALNKELTSWSAPVLVSGTLPKIIDACIVRKDSDPFYYMFFKNENDTSKMIELAKSSSLRGPYSIIRSGNWAGWNSGAAGENNEGIKVVRINDTTWRAYFDVGTQPVFNGMKYTGIVYSDSYDNWQTWTARKPISTQDYAPYSHGTVIKVANKPLADRVKKAVIDLGTTSLFGAQQTNPYFEGDFFIKSRKYTDNFAGIQYTTKDSVKMYASGYNPSLGYLIYNYKTGQVVLVGDTLGNVGINTTTPLKKFHTVGTVRHENIGTPSNDTTVYKPVGINTSGDIIPMTSWASSGGVTNLSLGTPTTTNIPIINSNGSGVSVPSATSSTAGLLSATTQTIAGAKTFTSTMLINPGVNATGPTLGSLSGVNASIGMTGGSGLNFWQNAATGENGISSQYNNGLSIAYGLNLQKGGGQVTVGDVAPGQASDNRMLVRDAFGAVDAAKNVCYLYSTGTNGILATYNYTTGAYQPTTVGPQGGVNIAPNSGNVSIGSTGTGAAKLDVTGNIKQTSVVSSMVKTSSTGEFIQAVQGADYSVGVSLLSTTTGINGLATGATNIYTPSSDYVITAVRVRATTATGVTNGPTADVYTSTAGDIFASNAIAALTSTTKIFNFPNVGMSTIASGGTAIKFNITAAGTGTTLILSVDIFGYKKP